MKFLRLLSCFLIFFVLQVYVSSSYASARLLVFPDDGVQAIVNEFNQAKYSIDIVMYGFTDNSIYKALVAAKKRGVIVRVLLQHFPYLAADENIPMINKLIQAGIKYQWSNPQFKITHQKTIVIDQREATIMTGNFTYGNFTKQRNFAIITDNPVDVKQIMVVFQADWNRQPIKVLAPSQLVWSPNDSQTKLVNYILAAKKSLLVYNQELGNVAILHALAFVAKKGVKVKIITPHKNVSQYCISLKYLHAHDVLVALDSELYIHAKGMLSNKSLSDARTFIGSINFSDAALNKNRELGIITDSDQVATRFNKTFQYDWSKSVLFNGACKAINYS